MRRDLPPRANLEHLKKQAKDLLDAHKRAEPVALARIRDAVPAFASMDDGALAAEPFALHDAQSAIAREYGKKSWDDLRDAVVKQGAPPDPGPSDDLLRALLPLPFPPEIGAALRATPRVGKPGAATAARGPLLERLPLIALRDAVFLPRALGPIHVARASSRAAIDAALTRTPPTLAIFSPQKTAAQEDIDDARSAPHPVGCEVLVHAHVPTADDPKRLAGRSRACGGSNSRRSTPPVDTPSHAWRRCS